jgi:hypothetical protein
MYQLTKTRLCRAKFGGGIEVTTHLWKKTGEPVSFWPHDVEFQSFIKLYGACNRGCYAAVLLHGIQKPALAASGVQCTTSYNEPGENGVTWASLERGVSSILRESPPQ